MKRVNVGFVIPRVWELPSIEVETANAKIYFYNFMMVSPSSLLLASCMI